MMLNSSHFRNPNVSVELAKILPNDVGYLLHALFLIFFSIDFRKEFDYNLGLWIMGIVIETVFHQLVGK